jgi:transmembrane sensor
MSTNGSVIPDLIIKYLKEKLSPQETEQLKQWMAQSPKNREFLESLDNPEEVIQATEEIEFGREEVWSKISEGIPGFKIKPLWPRRSMVAAAAIIITLVGGYLLFQNTANVRKQEISETKPPHDIPPGGNFAYLTTSDGKIHNLYKLNKGTLLNDGEAEIYKSEDGLIAYNSKDLQSSETQINTLTTPTGGNYQVVLADGSKVLLDAQSKLEYPTAFTGDKREVKVWGQAYFEVVKNKQKPFEVRYDGARVVVTGTKFNVKAYKDEVDIETTLEEGGIRVKATNDELKFDLKPGQQIVQTGPNEFKIVNNVDVEAELAWKDGKFEMTGTDIPAIMRQLSRWYDVDVVYENSAPTGTLSGTISKNLNLSQVIEILKKSGVKLRLDGRKLHVM